MKKNQVSIKQIKEQIKQAIEAKYGMSQGEFISSGIPEENGIDSKHLSHYLSPTGSVSFKTLASLCELLGIGILTKETKVVRENLYFLAM